MARKIVQTLAGSGLAQAFSIILYLVAARTSDPTRYGAAVSITTLALFFSVAANAGSVPYITQGMASGSISPQDFARLFWARCIRAALLSSLVASFGILNEYPWGTIASAAVLVPVAVASQCVLIVPRAHSRFALAGAATAIDKAVATCLMLAATTLGGLGPEVLPLVLALGGAAGTGVVIVASRMPKAYFLPIRRSHSSVRDHSDRRLSSWYASAGLLLAIQSLDVVAITYLGGASVAGEYAAVSKWGQPFNMVLSAMNLVLLTRLAAQGDSSETRGALRGPWVVVAGVLCVAGLCAITSDRLVALLLGSAFRASAAVLSLLMVGSMLSALSQIPLVYYQARRRPQRVALAVFGGVTTQFALVGALVPSLGALGAGIAWVGAQTVILLFLALPFLFERRLSGDKENASGHEPVEDSGHTPPGSAPPDTAGSSDLRWG